MLDTNPASVAWRDLPDDVQQQLRLFREQLRLEALQLQELDAKVDQLASNIENILWWIASARHVK